MKAWQNCWLLVADPAKIVLKIRAPNGPDYRFGGPNRSKLRSYRWFTVRPTPEPVRTIMDRFGLLVQALLA